MNSDDIKRTLGAMNDSLHLELAVRRLYQSAGRMQEWADQVKSENAVQNNSWSTGFYAGYAKAQEDLIANLKDILKGSEEDYTA